MQCMRRIRTSKSNRSISRRSSVRRSRPCRAQVASRRAAPGRDGHRARVRDTLCAGRIREQPSEDPHHYKFTLYALSKPLALSEGASLDELRDAMRDAVLARARLVGIYARPVQDIA